jgi:hypothetical protein
MKSIASKAKGGEGTEFKPKAINIFPTEVWIFPPATQEHVDTEELLRASLIKKQSGSTESASIRSARNAWRLENPHLQDEFKDAFDYIQNILSATCQKLRIEGGSRQFGSWLNVIEPGGYQVLHHHAPNILSGILYLTDCSTSARLILKDPRSTRLCFPETQLGPCEVPVSSAPGSAIIFPGWLEHRVEENLSEAPIGYIAFNLGAKLNNEAQAAQERSTSET